MIIIDVITWQVRLAANTLFFLCTCLMSNTWSTGVVLHWQCQHCDAANMYTMKALLLLPACRSLWHCAPTQSDFTAGRYRQFSLNLPITQFCLIVLSNNWELPSHYALVSDPWMELWHTILILLALCLNQITAFVVIFFLGDGYILLYVEGKCDTRLKQVDIRE